MIDDRRLNNWLKHFGIGTTEQLHCSGHLSGPEIKELIERAQPERVVPIHTELPEHFLDLHDNVEILSKGDRISL
jgi:ribonuclease J